MSQKRTIGIVATGHVGAAAAHAFCLRGAASEIILIDQDGARAEGEAMDLMHGQTFYETITVRAGAHKDLSAAQMMIVTAGVGQQTGGYSHRRHPANQPP